MKGWIVFISILAAILSFVVAGIGNIAPAEEKESAAMLEFSTFTSAVCENSEDAVYCKDEVFVNCNGEVSKAEGVAKCNGAVLGIPKALGFAVFEKGWNDPRN